MAIYVVLLMFLLTARGRSLDQHEVGGDKGKPLCCAKLANGSFSNFCQRTKLWAGSLEGSAATPNFPGRFPILKKCIWELYTQPGRRIRIDFRDFYLIGPGDNGVCYSQNVVITAPLSGLKVGPHCGNAGIPSVVSAGNYLIVELISNIPMTSEDFRGFRMAFQETTESPSRGLVSENMKKDVPPPNNLAPNTRDGTQKLSTPMKRIAKSTTRRPSRVRFGQLYLNPSLSPPAVLDRRPILPGREKEPTSSEISPMVIVGIAAGGILLIALLVTFSMKMFTRWRQKVKNSSVTRDVKTQNIPPQVPVGPEVTKQSQPVTGYYVYYYHDPRDRRRRKKSHSRQKHLVQIEKNASAKKTRTKKTRNHETRDSLAHKVILTGGRAAGQNLGVVESSGNAQSKKTAGKPDAGAVVSPLSINPSNRSSPSSKCGLKTLEKLRNTEIIEHNTVKPRTKPQATVKPKDLTL